ncbi:MAG: ribosome maturation factor RimP [Gaiellaceae bacterium]|jgi:ribosome maturation factor RimP
MTSVRERERELTSEVSSLVGRALPDVEVLAVEFVSPTRFCVFVDHPGGVDHELCRRVTDLLRGYLDRYTVDVSSPGLSRPLRKPVHFRSALGRRVALRTETAVGGRNRFRGRVVAAEEKTVRVAVEADEFEIPYDDLVRGNLIDEG